MGLEVRLFGLCSTVHAYHCGGQGLNTTQLMVIVHPRKPVFGFSHRDEWSGAWHVHLVSAPRKDQANRELIEECKKLFRSNVEIVRGKTSTKKVLSIGLPQLDVEQTLNSHRIH